MSESRRRVRLGSAAVRDFETILEWTAQTFGSRQAQVYTSWSQLWLCFSVAPTFQGANRAMRFSLVCARCTSGGGLHLHYNGKIRHVGYLQSNRAVTRSG